MFSIMQLYIGCTTTTADVADVADVAYRSDNDS
jgi:hypothetical protein